MSAAVVDCFLEALVSGLDDRADENGTYPISGNEPVMLAIDQINPSPENERIYHPIHADDPAVLSLAQSIAERGVLEPLVVSSDFWIISGHRRHVAAQEAGLDAVPCRIHPISRSSDPDGFLVLLREHNRQRIKSNEEMLREAVIDFDPDEALREVEDFRRSKLHVNLEMVDLGKVQRRSQITRAKRPMLEAALVFIESRRAYWPVTVRQIHYGLLNNPPLCHASKPSSVYNNTIQSYKNLAGLLIRARIEGIIPSDRIADETRPIITWNVVDDVQEFARGELSDLFKGYFRNVQRDQPYHVEIMLEKMALKGIVQPIAQKYRLPMTCARGYGSWPPREDLLKRFVASGKDKLAILVLTDFDPDGEVIAQSFGRSFRDDLHIPESKLMVHRAALTFEQTQTLAMPTSVEPKVSGSRYKNFVRKYGSADCYELDALEPAVLEDLLSSAIELVLDMDLFEAEIKREREDDLFLAQQRRRVQAVLEGGAE